MDQAGLVLLAVAALWIAYLVPHRLRTRQELLESRVEDRFSDGLRVLRVAHAAGPGTANRRATHRPADHTQVLIHPGGRRGGGALMNRPHAARDRAEADAVRRTAAEHARRAAQLGRRRAAARRRALLTLVLLVGSAVMWAVVGLGTAPLTFALVPTAGLLGVLGLGRRAVVAAARADAEWAAGAADRVPLPGTRTASRVTGRAVRPSDAETEVMARVRPAERRAVRQAGEHERPASSSAASGGSAGAGSADRADRADRTDSAGSAGGSGGAVTMASATAMPDMAEVADTVADEAEEPRWVPVPVPRPTYALKPSAPRRDPAPLPTEGLAHAPSGEGGDVAAPAGNPAAGSVSASATVPASVGTSSGAPLDLDAILARRRAAGE